jgi:murein DD-endopeptidase MepM/ murein hydrolase activator NlpD
MPTKSGITIFLVPHNRKKSLSLHLEAWQVTLGIILFGVAVLIFVFGVIAGGKSMKIVAENRSLRARNEMLRNERRKIADLERELAETNKLRKWMQSMIAPEGAQKSAEAKTAEVGGMGFLSMLDRPFEMRILPKLDVAEDSRLRRMDFIPRGVPVKGPVTARFGEMGGKFISPHTGIDIAAPKGTVVFTTAAGIVVAVDNDKQLGLVITIDHLNDYKTKYGHLNSASVTTGDWVERGQRIGVVGETGHARGTHVHYELLYRGEAVDPQAEKSIAEKEG